jgi:hypothetical protein
MHVSNPLTSGRLAFLLGATGAAGADGNLSPKNSLEEDAGQMQLVGDTASPGNNKVYGTDGSGTRGFYDAVADAGDVTFTPAGTIAAIYRFDHQVVDGAAVSITADALHIEGIRNDISLQIPNPYPDMCD